MILVVVFHSLNVFELSVLPFFTGLSVLNSLYSSVFLKFYFLQAYLITFYVYTERISTVDKNKNVRVEPFKLSTHLTSKTYSLFHMFNISINVMVSLSNGFDFGNISLIDSIKISKNPED